MTYEERTVRREDPVVREDRVVRGDVVRDDVVVNRTATVSPSGGEMARRLIVLVFGIIQILIALRIVFLLLNAREGNAIVSFVLDASQIFVAPFVGIFNSDALRAGGSVLDIAAVAALVGWTVLEAIALWAVNLFRREPA